MKNSKNSRKAVSAKQKSLPTNRVVTPFRGGYVNENVVPVEVEVNGHKTKVLVFTDMTLDAYLVALPQTGLKAQGKDRVFPIAKGDGLKAKFRVSNLSIGKLTEDVNASSRGKSWDAYCDEVTTYTKAELLRGADGKLVKDEKGKYVKTGNTVAKYPTISRKSEGLTAKQIRILDGVEKIMTSLYKREERLKAEQSAKQTQNEPKAQEPQAEPSKKVEKSAPKKPSKKVA